MTYRPKSKHEIVRSIKAVGNTEYQTLLEKRYLCFMQWEQIAVDMNYSIDNVFKLHKKALDCVTVPRTLQKSTENYSRKL